MTLATVNSTATEYVYDGEGRRVQKIGPGGTTTYVYDASGQLAAEYGTATDSDMGTRFVTADHLGSTRLKTDSTGAVTNCYDYLPFGGEIASGTAGRTASCFAATGADTFNIKFTGKERDSETGLDYLGARYMSSAQGRFTSPDWSNKIQPLPNADLRDPQSLNLYVYSRNNPLRYTDPDGHSWWSDFTERLVNTWKYGETVTNQELPQAFERERQWLINNVANGNDQIAVLQGVSTSDINKLYRQWDAAVANAQLAAGFETITPLSQFQRAEDGNLVVVFRGGSSMGATLRDVRVDRDTGLVKTSHGISVHMNPDRVAKFGGAYQVMDVPSELEVKQRGTDPGHFEITPRQPMTMGRYQELLNLVVTRLLQAP